MKRKAIYFLIFVPLAVLFLVGVTAGTLADVFDSIDGKCRDWFMEIYGK